MSDWPEIALKMGIEPGTHIDRIARLEAALDIRWAEIDRVHVDHPRRLTGPGHLWIHPGAVTDVFFDDLDPDVLIALWNKHARKVLDAVGWHDQGLIHRVFQGGVSLAISAPMDQLYSATFVVKTAWHYCAAALSDTASLPFEDMIHDLKRVMAQEANPALIALIEAASIHGVDILCDDENVSLGHGIGSRTWPADDLPTPAQVGWSDINDVPVALVTGTNGKTTTTRLCAAIATAAEKIAGLTSTDVVQVGGDILDRGDYSGPGGGRMMLRDTRVELGCLEVARGGILRRGLPTRRARVAVVTNIAADHLDEYGITTLAELAEVKFAVARALVSDGVLVLNANDPIAVEEAAKIATPVWWFSHDPAAPLIRQAQGRGTPCSYIKNGVLTFHDGVAETFTIAVADVPVTLQGAARHNVQNVLAAICVCTALGISDHAIRAGLSGFVSDHKDNPGRFNEFQYKGARVFVDFAHNTHSIAAISDALSSIPSNRRFIMLSQPGDHSDQDIADVTHAALQFRPDIIVAAEIEDYLRGRDLGETTSLIKASAIAGNTDPESILSADSAASGAKMILDLLQPGDLALLLVLSDRQAVFDLLMEHLR
ncbi:Mur ligase family protein [Marivita lacus]|uniref:Mur ligase family protein n=1 Tax=Marivita lacus TaxID=1323742 RepID=UPI00166CD1DD|nr:Mur ligase family protein [Marivita lacus]